MSPLNGNMYFIDCPNRVAPSLFSTPQCCTNMPQCAWFGHFSLSPTSRNYSALILLIVEDWVQKAGLWINTKTASRGVKQPCPLPLFSIDSARKQLWCIYSMPNVGDLLPTFISISFRFDQFNSSRKILLHKLITSSSSGNANQHGHLTRGKTKNS